MNQKNRFTNLLPKILLGLAIIGFFVLGLMLGGRSFYRPNSTDTFRLYPLVIGLILMIPYLIYLLASKSKPRKKLQGNRTDSSKASATNNRKKGTFEIFVLNESNNTLIVNRNSELENNQWHIFQVKPNDSIFFSNGIVFTITDDHALTIADFRNQILEIGNDYFQKNEPENVDFAFVITEPNNGDTDE
jgi:hypothetical protein